MEGVAISGLLAVLIIAESVNSVTFLLQSLCVSLSTYAVRNLPRQEPRRKDVLQWSHNVCEENPTGIMKLWKTKSGPHRQCMRLSQTLISIKKCQVFFQYINNHSLHIYLYINQSVERVCVLAVGGGGVWLVYSWGSLYTHHGGGDGDGGPHRDYIPGRPATR